MFKWIKLQYLERWFRHVGRWLNEEEHGTVFRTMDFKRASAFSMVATDCLSSRETEVTKRLVYLKGTSAKLFKVMLWILNLTIPEHR